MNGRIGNAIDNLTSAVAVRDYLKCAELVAAVTSLSKYFEERSIDVKGVKVSSTVLVATILGGRLFYRRNRLYLTI